MIHMDSTFLSDLKTGDHAVILGFSSEEVPTKLYEIGFVPGVELTVYQKAPFNGPICISIGQEECKLALGMNEAHVVLVQKIE